MNTTNFMKRTIVAAVIIIFSASFTNVQAAFNTELPTADTTKPNSFIIKYLGETEDNLAFNVSFKKQDNEVYTLMVKDDVGETLFQQFFSAKTLSKKIIVTPSDEFKKLSVSITDAKGKTTLTKEIVISARLVQDYVVKID